MSRGEGGCEGLYFLPAPFINFSTSVSEAGHSLKDVGLLCGLNTHRQLQMLPGVPGP